MKSYKTTTKPAETFKPFARPMPESALKSQKMSRTQKKINMDLQDLTELFENAPLGYFTFDANGIICDINHNGSEMIGDNRLNLISKSFNQFMTAGYQKPFTIFLDKILNAHSQASCLVELALSGVSTHQFILMKGIQNADENTCLVTAIDITEYKDLKSKLVNSEKQYRRLFESAKDGILILDAVTGQIVDVNPYLMQLLGYTYQNFLGKELWEIGVFKNINDSKAAFIELQKEKYIRFEDLPLETKSGKAINVEFVCNVYLVDQTEVIQCNIRDITERKIAEKALKQSESRLLEMNEAKDKFFSIISHDLRAPFNCIVGFADILASKIQEKDYRRSEEYALLIQKTSWHALELLQNLIDWSTSQTGRMTFYPADVELKSIIFEIAKFSTYSARQKSITISRDIPENLSIFADRGMISIVLRNIISNAVKFTDTGGAIKITAIRQTGQVEIIVSDNGVGIKSEVLKNLFKIKENNSTMGTQDELGTGLGLVLCKEFITKHHGKIWVESEPGVGTQFHFSLPDKRSLQEPVSLN